MSGFLAAPVGDLPRVIADEASDAIRDGPRDGIGRGPGASGSQGRRDAERLPPRPELGLPSECIAEYRTWREQQERRRRIGRPRKGVSPATVPATDEEESRARFLALCRAPAPDPEEELAEAEAQERLEELTRSRPTVAATEEKARAARMRIFAAPEEQASSPGPESEEACFKRIFGGGDWP